MATRVESGARDESPAAQPYLDILLSGGLGSHVERMQIARQRELEVWIPLLVHYDPEQLAFEGRTPHQAFVELLWLDEAARGMVVIPDAFKALPEPLEMHGSFDYCVLLLQPEFAARTTASSKWHKVILQAEVGPPLLLPAAKKIKPPLHPFAAGASNAAGPFESPEQVVIAVIDSGIAFLHPRFRSMNATRIAWLWQQDQIGQGTQTLPGREFTSADIDMAFANAYGDEDRAYRALKCIDMTSDGFKPLSRRRTHGTQVLDLAANPGAMNGSSALPLIAVDMPDASVGDPAGSTLKVHAAWALIYILWRAQGMVKGKKSLPVVVNLSYGPHEGSHDGLDILERVMDLVTDATRDSQTPVQIVLAAGNSRQSRTHAAFGLCHGAHEILQWRLQPGGLSPSYAELWLPPVPGAGIKVSLIPPDSGAGLSVSAAQPSAEVKDTNGKLVMSARYVGAGVQRRYVVVGIAPTSPTPGSPGSHGVAPSGIYDVKVEYVDAQGHAQLDIHVWLKRGDTPRGRRARARQSVFDDPRYQRFDDDGRRIKFDPSGPPPAQSVVRRSNTLSGIATGQWTTVVGGYRRDEGLPTDYTSEGGLRHTNRYYSSPNWLSASDESAAVDGILSAGSRAESWVSMNGTSAAAPQAAHRLATQWLNTGIRPTDVNLPLTPIPPGRLPPNHEMPTSGKGLLATARRRGRP